MSMTRDEIFRELKTVREVAYGVKKDLNDFIDRLQEKNEADLTYVAMMSGVELDDESEEEGTEDE